jgi:hypothetical protein
MGAAANPQNREFYREPMLAGSGLLVAEEWRLLPSTPPPNVRG